MDDSETRAELNTAFAAGLFSSLSADEQDVVIDQIKSLLSEK